MPIPLLVFICANSHTLLLSLSLVNTSPIHPHSFNAATKNDMWPSLRKKLLLQSDDTPHPRSHTGTLSPLNVPEILELIFSYLDTPTLRHTVCLVCRQWLQMNQDRVTEKWYGTIVGRAVNYAVPCPGSWEQSGSDVSWKETSRTTYPTNRHRN